MSGLEIPDSPQQLLPAAFWTALSNQNLVGLNSPQWSIVVNDSGVQCSIFFENAEAASSRASDSSGVISAESPLAKNSIQQAMAKVPTPDDSFEKMNGEEIETIPTSSSPSETGITGNSPPVSAPPVSLPGNLPNIPLLHQFLGQQIAAAAAAANGNSNNSPANLGMARPEEKEKPVPGDLMLIEAENRRRLINLREEASANRLSVTAFIRRGALLYFNSDELALNRLHTLDQKRLNALELETKFYFGDIPQQLFRRTIAIQQSQIRSKKSNSAEGRVRFRPNNGFSFSGFNPNSLVNTNANHMVNMPNGLANNLSLPSPIQTTSSPMPNGMGNISLSTLAQIAPQPATIQPSNPSPLKMEHQ